MTTDSTNNSYVKDGRLYIVPTLTVSFFNLFLNWSTSQIKTNFNIPLFSPTI